MEFNELMQEQVIKEYLQDFPTSDWKAVIKKIIMYGIHSLKAIETVGLTSPKIKKVPALRLQIAELKNDAPKKQGKENLVSVKSNIPCRSTSQNNIAKKSQGNQRSFHNSHNRSTPKGIKLVKYHNGKYPTKLIGREFVTSRESRNKGELDKSILGNKALTGRFPEKKIQKFIRAEKDENSSLSTFNPTEDMQKVFRNDFGKPLISNSIPKILQPVEIKAPMHHANFSSISAQVFCSSSEISD